MTVRATLAEGAPWSRTMPRRNASIRDVVLAARVSVLCSTYNFQRTSRLWAALQEVAQRGFVEIRLYLDPEAATNPSLAEVASHLPGAHVFVTAPLDGRRVRNRLIANEGVGGV